MIFEDPKYSEIQTFWGSALNPAEAAYRSDPLTGGEVG